MRLLKSSTYQWDYPASTWLVLYRLGPDPAAHPGRSPLRHSYGYDSAGDCSTCFAGLTPNPNPSCERRVNPPSDAH